jgi:hypothetical protein
MPSKTFPSWFDGIHVSTAFIAFEKASREHNEVSDGASDPLFEIRADT